MEGRGWWEQHMAAHAGRDRREQIQRRMEGVAVGAAHGGARPVGADSVVVAGPAAAAAVSPLSLPPYLPLPFSLSRRGRVPSAVAQGQVRRRPAAARGHLASRGWLRRGGVWRGGGVNFFSKMGITAGSLSGGDALSIGANHSLPTPKPVVMHSLGPTVML